MGQDQARVIAVVVAYRPDFKRLAAVLESIAGQVAGIVLVNNGTEELRPVARAVGAVVQELGCNRGLAAGLNAGIARARRLGASHVLLLDQDSVPAADLVLRLLGALTAAAGARPPPAAAGPLFVEARTGRPAFFVRFGRLGLRRLRCTGDETVSCGFLITSGSLIPVEVLDRVGPMDESLFIEHVDTDWHLRARAAGYRALGVCAARLSHQRGAATVRFAGLDLPRHIPLRHYYLLRNSLWLYRRPYAPWRWILADVVRNLAWMAAVLLTHGDRGAHLRAMARGIRDGLGTPPPPPVARP